MCFEQRCQLICLRRHNQWLFNILWCFWMQIKHTVLSCIINIWFMVSNQPSHVEWFCKSITKVHINHIFSMFRFRSLLNKQIHWFLNKLQHYCCWHLASVFSWFDKVWIGGKNLTINGKCHFLKKKNNNDNNGKNSLAQIKSDNMKLSRNAIAFIFYFI